MVAKLRTKTILLIAVGILAVSSCYLFYYISKQRENVNLLIESHQKQVRTLLSFYVDLIDKQYRSRIIWFAGQKKEIVKSFARRDRVGLYNAALPIYEHMRLENSYLEHVKFILPDGTVFLNMQNHVYGDNEKTGYCFDAGNLPEKNVPVGGFVYGRCGLYYAVLMPIFYEDVYVGAVIFGVKIAGFVDDIQNNFGIRTSLAIKSPGHSEGTLAPRKISVADFTLYPLGDTFFKQKAEEIDVFSERQKISYGDSMMMVFPSYIIRDRHGDEIGRVLQALNLTDISASYKNDLIRLALVTITVLVAASIFLFLNFDKVLSELIRLNKSLLEKNDDLVDSEKRLESQIVERTSELKKTNYLLQREVERRKDANLSLSRSIVEWQNTFDAITDAVTIIDRDLVVVIANKAAYELLALEEYKTVAGKKCYELFVERATVCDECPAMGLSTKGEQRKCEIENKSFKKTLYITCAPIYDEDELLGFVHIVRDITEEKKLKNQLVQAQKMEAIATLAGGIAHDFNNILGAILGNADLLLYRLSCCGGEKGSSPQVKLSSDDIESHLNAIKQAGNRAKDLVSQILAFSRQDKSRHQNVIIAPVIKEGVKLLRSSLPANIEIKTVINPDICHVHADLAQVQQVFMNLCTNAAQAMAEHGGTLDVSLDVVQSGQLDETRFHDLDPNQSYVSLKVKDTGHGIPPEVMERIFDPFFSTKDVSEGTGMGLAVIHGIVTTHGGDLQVQSKVGVGSEFTVLLPCVEPDADATEDVVLGVPLGNEKVLFVEDEADILKMSVRMLEYLGYTVYSATSGEEAFDLLVKESLEVDLVITDYSMTGISGVELSKLLRDAGKNIPVILCSGYSDSVIMDQEVKHGIVKFMSKPLEMKKMAVLIRQVFNHNAGV